MTHHEQTDRKGKWTLPERLLVAYSSTILPNYTAISVHLSDFILIVTGDGRSDGRTTRLQPDKNGCDDSSCCNDVVVTDGVTTGDSQ